MTTPKDSAAVIKANEVLANDASVEALSRAKDGIRDELCRLGQAPRIELAMAASMTQRREMQDEQEHRQAEKEILTRLFQLLGDAIQQRRAKDAIDSADDDRARLDRLLAAAQDARQRADQAIADALAQIEVIKRARAAAGREGAHTVGATTEQLDNLLALMPDSLLTTVGRRRLRLHTELPEPLTKAR